LRLRRRKIAPTGGILAEAAAVDAAEDAAAAGGAGPGPDEAVRGRGAKRRARLKELLAELETEAADKSYESHMARRAEIEARTGRPIRGRSPTPESTRHRSRRRANVTDPDSRLLKAIIAPGRTRQLKTITEHDRQSNETTTRPQQQTPDDHSSNCLTATIPGRTQARPGRGVGVRNRRAPPA
jgi:hypothetical protein